MARIRVMAACLPEIACVPQRDGVLFFDPAIMISEEFDAAGGGGRADLAVRYSRILCYGGRCPIIDLVAMVSCKLDLIHFEAQELHGIATEQPGFGIVVKA